MNFITKKSIYTLGVLLVSISSFAFPADPDPTSDPVAPIDSNIYILLFLGVAFVAYYFSKRNIKA